jgi:hypothetical protein
MDYCVKTCHRMFCPKISQKPHREVGFSNIRVSKKAEIFLSVLFMRIFTVTVSDPRRGKKKQSNRCWLQVDKIKYTSIQKCRRCLEKQEVHAIALEICF